MQTKLFLRLILVIIFLIGNHNIHAQDCAKVGVVVDGSNCSTNGKAKVTINVTAIGNATLDLSKVVYTISMVGEDYITLTGNTAQLVPGKTYVAYAEGILCNNGTVAKLLYSDPFTVKLGLNITKAEYIRCSANDVSVEVAVLGGTGPSFTYRLLDGDNKLITSQQSDSKQILFPATTSSSNLKIEVIDNGCNKNNPVSADLKPKFNIGQSIIEGDKTACKGGTIKLSVKNGYSGSNFKWTKGNTVVSTTSTLQIQNVTETHAGKYTFSMNFEGCSNPYTEDVTVEVGDPPKPNVKPAYPCFNSGEVLLSKYVTTTSNDYSLMWYKADATPIGETAPKFNPNLPGTTKYLVSQKNKTGCESPKAELTVIVENLPPKIDENNINVCTSNDSKAKMRVFSAGDYTYNLYKTASGGTKIGSGTAVNDTATIVTTQDLVLGETYFLETQNAHGCVSAERTIIKITIKDSWILGKEKICFGDKLSLSADYAGGRIVWTKPDKSTFEGKTLIIDSIDFNKAGVYSLLIEEQGLGCTMTDEIHVTITQPAPPTVAVDTLRYVQDEPAKAMTATAKTGMKLKWYNHDGKLMSEQSPKPATDEKGVFVYRVSQDSLGCESPKVPITVIVGTVPPAVPASDINICIADKPTVKIANTVKDYTYTVYSQKNVIAEGKGNSGEISLTSKVSITKNTEIEITVTDIYGVKSAATKKSLITPAGLIAENHSAVCFGSDFQLTAIDIKEASYAWKSPSGVESDGKSISVTDSDSKDAGIYTLTVTTVGCPAVSVTQSVRITQPEPPKVDKDSYRYFEGETAKPLTATPKTGCTLKWYNPDGELLSEKSPVPATDKKGAFVYRVSQDSLGCESPKVEIKVIVGTIPSAVPASNIKICIADKPIIHIDSTIQDYKYSVYYKKEVIAEGKGNGNSISLTSKDSITKNTELEITVSDTFNVSSERTKVNLISVNNLIDSQNSTPSICKNSTGKLTAINIIGATYEWTTPKGNKKAEQSITIPNASSADTGRYILAVTTSGCPVAEQPITVKVEKPATPSATEKTSYCKGDKVDTLKVKVLPGYKLVWFDESKTQLANAPKPNTSAGDTSYYVMQVSISDANCVSDTGKITVVVKDKPAAVDLKTANVCSIPGNTQPISVRIQKSVKDYKYSLYTQSTGGSLAGEAKSDSDSSNVDIVIKDGEVNSGTIYYLEVKDTVAGCMSDRTPVEIVVTEVTLSPDELPPYQVGEYYSQRLTTTAPNPEYKIVEGYYLPAAFTLSSMGDISGTATDYADTSTFMVEMKSSLGCSVQKKYKLKSELSVSKMFSPNHDGHNDIFMQGYKVIVFDRLGRKLFSGDDGWDGTYHGKVMPEDVYYYIIYYKDSEGKERTVTSYVTLLIRTM